MQRKKPVNLTERAADAATGAALRARVRDLESRLAQERGTAVERIKTVDRNVRVLRETLHKLQSGFRAVKGERDQLRREVEARSVRIATLERDLEEQRERVTRLEGDPGADTGTVEVVLRREDVSRRAVAAERALAGAQEEVTELRERLRELDSRPRVPAVDPEIVASVEALRAGIVERDYQLGVREKKLSHRKEELVLAAEKLEELESKLGVQNEELAQLRRESVETREVLVAQKRRSDRERAAPVAAEARESAPHSPSKESPPESEPVSTRPGRKVPPDPATPSPVKAPPRRVGDSPQVPGLRIERPLTEDASGQRFFAREIRTRRPVLLRILPKKLGELDGKKVDALILSKHPNLVSALSFGVCDAGPYLVFERPAGETARSWVGRIGTLPEHIALAVVLQAARGLRHAAFHGVLHGDLSPDDVLIDAGGRVQLHDVGGGIVYGGVERPVPAPEFASPERLRGSRQPDARADVYSLGALLYFLLIGTPAFEGDRDRVAKRQASNLFPDPREIRPEIREGVGALVVRLCARDPDQRPGTWDEVLVELERLVPGSETKDLKGNLESRIVRSVTKRPYLFATLAALPLLAAAIAFHVLADAPPTAGERLGAARLRVEELVNDGEIDEAVAIYRRFLSGTGDPSVEREAASLLDDLERRFR